MTAAALVAELRRAGAVLTVEGERLRVNAPRGALTPERSAVIAAEKGTLMAFLVAEADALTLDRLDVALSDDGAEPEPPPAADPSLAQTVANARALDPSERAVWREEIVAGLRWAEAGHAPDPNLAHDLAALRVLVPLGTCLRCDAPCPATNRHWCVNCSVKEAKVMEVKT